MAEKKNILTYAGLKQYEDELQDLKVNKRRRSPRKLKKQESREICPRMRNTTARKDEQRDIEARIEALEKLLKNAEVVVEDEIDLDKISVGCKVKLLDVEEDEEMEFKIVGFHRGQQPSEQNLQQISGRPCSRLARKREKPFR